MTISELNELSKKGFIAALGIHFTNYEEGQITGKLEVGPSHFQPGGVVHGGVFIAFAETMAGAGSTILVKNLGKVALGSTINSQHLAPVREGTLTAIATIIYKGAHKHIWDVQITDQNGNLISISRVINSIKDLKMTDDEARATNK